MEALTSMTVATLAVIDMAKGVDRSALAPGPGPGRLPPGTHTRTDLRKTSRTQRLDPALVCGPVFPNSLPCVRHKGDPRGERDGWIPAGPRGEQRTIARIPLKAAVRAAP